MTIQQIIYIVAGAFIFGLGIGFGLFIFMLNKNKKLSDFIDIFKQAQLYIEEVENDYSKINKFVGQNTDVKNSINENKLTDVYAKLIEYANDNNIKSLNELNTKDLINEQVAFSKMQQKYK